MNVYQFLEVYTARTVNITLEWLDGHMCHCSGAMRVQKYILIIIITIIIIIIIMEFI